MTAPGNHEGYDKNFIPYSNRWAVGNPSRGGFWYSFDYGAVHFLSISTEHDYSVGSPQYNFILHDLYSAYIRKIAGIIQFIIVFGHKPMYSSSSNHGSDFTLRAALELIFVNYTVDIAVWGHDHTYERTYPVFNSVVKDQSIHEYYTPHRATIHTVVGNSGQHLYAFSNQPNWSAYREAEFGISYFLASTNGSFYWNYIRESTNKTQDYFKLINNPAQTVTPTLHSLIPSPTPTTISPRHSSYVSTVILLLILFALLAVVLGTFLYLKYREKMLGYFKLRIALPNEGIEDDSNL